MFPGLKIVAPSTPSDAKGLMKSAIRDNNPVLFLEYKYLYRRVKEEVPESDELVPIGKGKVRREGDAAVVVTYGPTVQPSVDAADQLAKETGKEARVVDLRSIQPLDRELIVRSVRETGKILIVHEATLTGGFGGEIAAVVASEAFEYLDAPVQRLGSLDSPVPFAPTLEEAFLPGKHRIIEALKDLIRY